MIKICALLLLAVVHFGCASTVAPAPSNSPTVAVSPTQPETPPGPSAPQPLSDMARLEERFPKGAREIMEAADRIRVYELKECGFSVFTPTLTPIEKNKFQGCTLDRQTEVRDQKLRKELVERIWHAIASSGNGNACFEPRHGIRAEHDGRRVELIICFECENFRGVSTVGNFGGGFFATGVEEFFERILSRKRP